ncbi:hypothetical protein BCR44DRAFT_1438314 [Catenaria anguillulae PL171]|uniref:Uncharacterized protein n=1 Tax=Catenaria anguillulae PL171 TaxID=765915 RepID=A0A1Y2HH80_9FUNG|nr:hypothetical protein BCR44DRAFT_1438314 [Catenaria anguillulae PL171]
MVDTINRDLFPSSPFLCQRPPSDPTSSTPCLTPLPPSIHSTMTKLTLTTTKPVSTKNKHKPVAAKGQVLQTLTLYRSMVVGKLWDRFEPNSNDNFFPYTVFSCGNVPDSITLDQHILHGWTNRHESPYISFAGSHHRVPAIWYHLKQEYMRLTFGAQPNQAGRFAPRALYKIEELAMAMDEHFGRLRVRVKSFEAIVVPDKLMCASFAWFAATYRASGPSFSLADWRRDMEAMAMALQDQDLMAIFELAMPNNGFGSDSSSDSDSDGSDSDSDSDRILRQCGRPRRESDSTDGSNSEDEFGLPLA